MILFLCHELRKPLQAVKAAVWLTSFDLAQGYLQLAMDKADIHKTAFRVQVPQVCTSLLVCPLDSLMQVLVFVTLWKCAWVTNNI